MRKLLLSILVVFLPLYMFGRNEAEQDTLVVNKADKVVVITSDSAQTIMIRGKEGNPDFKYSNSIQLVDSNYVSTSEMGKNWSISLWPIAKNSSKATSYPTTEIVGNFFVGFNGAPGMPSEADFRMFSSWELWWLTDVRVYPWNGHHCFSLGLGLDWRNYRIKGNTCFVKTENNEIKFVAGSLEEPTVFRLAGANRYDTASHISNKMYGNSDTVIIATGLTFNDALVAVPLASAYDAPLLLTTDKQVTKYTEERLKKLNAKKVIIVSTSGAVGSKVTTALAKYDPTVISGKTCFETAAKVAKALQTKTKKTPDTIFFATDSSFADALSASPIAAIKGVPIMYLKNTGSIDKVTADYLKSVKGKVKNAYIIGGDGVISDAMMKNVANALGLTLNKTVQRVAGKNRYETCVAVNNKFAGLLTGKGICVAKGLDFPDALAGGVLAAKNRIPLFLADGKKLLDCQNTYLKGRKASKLYVLGGTGAVSDELVMLIAQASV